MQDTDDLSAEMRDITRCFIESDRKVILRAKLILNMLLWALPPDEMTDADVDIGWELSRDPEIKAVLGEEVHGQAK